MSALTIYCAHHGRNHSLTGREAEDLIQALIAQWADEAAAPSGVYLDDDPTTLAYSFCPIEDLSTLRGSECYGEHLEAMRESRLAAKAEQ